MTLTVGSLFSGIGGLDLGLERAGMKVLWQVEKDPYARRVLAKHWPDVRCHEDVRDIHAYKHGPGAVCGNCLYPVDLLCGGFPCQDISVAGKGAGIKEGTRSGLWLEFARIVRELRPRYVLVENVPALRSRGLDRVLGDLAASGYDAEWDGLSARAVGAPHQRDRLFLIAYARCQSLRVEQGRRGGQGWAGAPEPRHDGIPGHVADSYCFAAGRAAVARAQCDQWAFEPDVGRVAHGVPARVDRLRCLGNAVVPQVAEFVGRGILEHARRDA